MMHERDILSYFKNWDLTEESKAYLLNHCARYSLLLKRVADIVNRNETGDQLLKILDIGPSFQTDILRNTYSVATVNSLGFEDLRFKLREQDRHFHFDLNDAQYEDKWPSIEKHDIIIMAEVLEHLYTSPKLVLKCVSSWLKRGGYLIIQTPNACALHKRLRMLIGRNPFEMIRDTRTNPGHFREYTISELTSISLASGFKVCRYETHNYFNVSGSNLQKVYHTSGLLLPRSLREGMTFYLQL